MDTDINNCNPGACNRSYTWGADKIRQTKNRKDAGNIQKVKGTKEEKGCGSNRLGREGNETQVKLVDYLNKGKLTHNQETEQPK